jgi:FkbM family methyltransferase
MHALRKSLRKYRILQPLRLAYSIRLHPAGHVLFWLFRRRTLTMYDIGSHLGTSTNHYSFWFPQASFELFEADPAVAAKCRELNPPNQRIRLHNFACGDADGSAEFFTSKRPLDEDSTVDVGASGSLLQPSGHIKIFPQVPFAEVIKVEVRRLDGWIKETGTIAPSFIHMDVQGAELLVLHGLGAYFETVEAIWLEVENQELYANQPLKPEIEEFFQSRGWTKIIDTVNDIAGDQLWVSPISLNKLKGFGWFLHKVWFHPWFA